MPETFGSFEDLIYKLGKRAEEGWDGEICIRTRVDGPHHGYTNHYYLRKFNKEKTENTGKLELDIPDSQEIGEPRSIDFEDLKNGKYKITVANFYANGVECQEVDEMFWWKYEENPRLNAKGGKRRKTRRRIGGGKVFSSLKQLFSSLANEQYNTNQIFFQIGNGEVNEGILIDTVDMYEQEVLPVLQEGPLRLTKLDWIRLKHGDIKVKKELDEDWWQYYEEGAKGGRKKTRRKRGKGQVFSRRNNMIGKILKKPDDGTIWEIITEQNGIVQLKELTDGTGGTGDGFILGPIDLSILQQVGWKFEGISSSSGSSGGRKRKTRKCKNKWSVSTNFDAGNIIKKRCETINDINIYTLEIKKDPYPKHTRKKYQNWYYFQVNNVKGKKCKFIIENLVNIDNDWKGHKVVYTYDHKCFYRHSTKLNEKQNYITWNFTPKKNKIWFSYYVPYSRDRVYKLNKKISKRNDVTKIILGKTSLNNKIELLRFGKGLKHIFIIARQHPGETIGSWMLEGFLKSLFSSSFKKQYNILFNKFTFHIISMVNPDGVQLGHWYTQKNGHNCNREWMKKKCPEVKMIDKYMKQYEGCLYFDFHGDEGCKKHFFTTCDRTKKNKDSAWNFFRNRMKHYSKNFDKEDYYKKAAHNVHGTFDCAWENALTLEGCMKHDYKKECVSLEPLRIGKYLYKSIYDWSFTI